MDQLSTKALVSVWVKKATDTNNAWHLYTHILLESKYPGTDRCGLTYYIVCLCYHFLFSTKSSLTCMPSIIAHVQPHGRPFACKTQGRDAVSGMFALKEKQQHSGMASAVHVIVLLLILNINKTS